MTVPLVVLAALSVARRRARPAVGARRLARRLPARPSASSPPVAAPSTRPSRSRRASTSSRPSSALAAAFTIWRDRVSSTRYEPSVPRARLALGRRLRRDHRAPARRARRAFGDDVVEPQRHRRRRRRRRRWGAPQRRGPAQGPVGLRAPLRPGHGARPRRDHRLPRGEGRVSVHSSFWLDRADRRCPLVGALGGRVRAQARGPRLRWSPSPPRASSSSSRSSWPVLYNDHVAGRRHLRLRDAPRPVGTLRPGLRRGDRRDLAADGRADRAGAARRAARRARQAPRARLRRLAAAADVASRWAASSPTTCSSSSSSSS